MMRGLCIIAALFLILVLVACSPRFEPIGRDANGTEYGFLAGELVTVTPIVTTPAPAPPVGRLPETDSPAISLSGLTLDTRLATIVGFTFLLILLIVPTGLAIASYADDFTGRRLRQATLKLDAQLTSQAQKKAMAIDHETEARRLRAQYMAAEALTRTQELQRTFPVIFAQARARRFGPWGYWVMRTILDNLEGQCSVKATRKVAYRLHKIPFRFTEEFLKGIRHTEQNGYPVWIVPPDPTRWVCVRKVLNRGRPYCKITQTWELLPIEQLGRLGEPFKEVSLSPMGNP